MTSFRIGQKVITNDDETGWIKDVRGKEYLVNIRRTGAIKIYNYSELQALAVDPLKKKATPLKMTLALEETLKEIIHHLNDGNYKLTEQYLAHDYSSINKSHDIKITIVLKENE